jgi:glycosyltransferase involved in cell wall biosynthesis
VITGHNFVILSTQDWDAMPTRKHRWARNWARQGNRVLYVEQQMHWAGWLIDIRRQFGRAFRWLGGPREIEPNLWVFTLPVVLPFFQMNVAINWFNNLWLTWILRWAIKRVGMAQPILWTYTPHSADFVEGPSKRPFGFRKPEGSSKGKLGQTFTVYECVDEFSAAKGLVHGPTIAAMERELLRKVDLTIVTAPALLENKAPFTRRCEVVRNGVDVEHFARASQPETVPPAAVANLPRPVVGFLGGVQYWIDFDLIAHAARTHPEWSFAFVGPVEPLARVDKVRGLPNVHFLGRQPYAQVPAYVAGFDVCINPYILDDVAEKCDPLKLYDYLASGKPVVSVDMPAARRFADLMPLTRTPDEFTHALENVLTQLGDSAARDGAVVRQRVATEHSWAARFKHVEAALESALPL